VSNTAIASLWAGNRRGRPEAFLRACRGARHGACWADRRAAREHEDPFGHRDQIANPFVAEVDEHHPFGAGAVEESCNRIDLPS
jgi:hypothetical protein